MKETKWSQARKKNPLIKRGSLVSAYGENYVVSNVVNGAVRLKRTILVHPADVRPKRRTVVCLCGSTRFSEAYQQANLNLTLAGKIVLTIGCDMKSDASLFADQSPEALERVKQGLDETHLCKIDLADEIFVLNVGGYIGESTRREIAYARQLGKGIRYLEADRSILFDKDGFS